MSEMVSAIVEVVNEVGASAGCEHVDVGRTVATAIAIVIDVVGAGIAGGTSAPAPPTNVSLPVAPLTVSLPASPQKVVARAAVTLSVPAPANTTGLLVAVAPFSVSLSSSVCANSIGSVARSMLAPTLATPTVHRSLCRH
jgi:hypothetical protein